MFRSIDKNNKIEQRNYLVVGCAKHSYDHSPLIHPDNKWASLDEMPVLDSPYEGKNHISEISIPDYIFSVGQDNPDELPKPVGGYKVIFFEYIPIDIYYHHNKINHFPIRWNRLTQLFLNKCIADDGILIVNNYLPSLQFAKSCGFNGDMIITSYGYVVIAKSEKTNLRYYLDHNDLIHIIEPNTIPSKRYSSELNVLSGREHYKTLMYLYDICVQYTNTRSNNIFRNFFLESTYQSCLQTIATYIKSVLSDESVNPENVLLTLKAFAENHLIKKEFSDSFFPRYTYTMNRLLECTVHFCHYVITTNLGLNNQSTQCVEFDTFNYYRSQ